MPVAVLLSLCVLVSAVSPAWGGQMFLAENTFSKKTMLNSEVTRTSGPRFCEDMRFERSGRRGLPDILMHYPTFGVTAVDRDIALWALHIAGSFERDFATQEALEPATPLEQGTGNEAWLSANYILQEPSDKAVSLVFDVWMHTGAGMMSLDVLTLSYNMVTGQRLHLVDIFENVDTALRILSDRSRVSLARGIGRGRVDSTIAAGTMPVEENFSSIALTPTGVRVYFQPYQVTMLGGSQKVDIELDDLMSAGPLLALWGRDE